MKKTVSFDNLNHAIAKIIRKKKVLVGGCFDLLHYGHLTFLKNARKEGNFLIVALESDEFIQKQKKREPIHNQQQRAEILESLIFVDLVIKIPLFNSDEEYSNLVETIKPEIIAVTEGDKQIKNKKKQAEKIGAKLKVVSNLIEGFSSQKIISAFD